MPIAITINPDHQNEHLHISKRSLEVGPPKCMEGRHLPSHKRHTQILGSRSLIDQLLHLLLDIQHLIRLEIASSQLSSNSIDDLETTVILDFACAFAF